MHLGQRVPTLWYHARVRTTGNGQEPPVDETGVTLPGAPLLVAGSNGHVAWGFTNSYGDWLNVALVPCSSVSDTAVQTPTGTIPLSMQREVVRVQGAAPVLVKVV